MILAIGIRSYVVQRTVSDADVDYVIAESGLPDLIAYLCRKSEEW